MKKFVGGVIITHIKWHSVDAKEKKNTLEVRNMGFLIVLAFFILVFIGLFSDSSEGSSSTSVSQNEIYKNAPNKIKCRCMECNQVVMIPKQYLNLARRGIQTAKCPNCDWKMRKVKIIQEWGLEPTYPEASVNVTETVTVDPEYRAYSWRNDDRLDLAAAGLDIDDLELMDEDERREAIENEGLDPDDYDFF